MGSEWSAVPLGEVASVRSGYAFKSRDWADSGVPVVKIANVKAGRLDLNGCSFVTEEIAENAGEFNLELDDIVIAMTGYIGETARVQSTDLPCVLNQRVGKFKVMDSNRLDPDYLYAFLSWKSTRERIEALGYGSAQPNVSPKLIHQVEIPLPPMPKQQAIAEVLGSLDDKIELNRRMNRTLESMAECIYADTFADTTAWETKRLDDLTTVSIGRTPPRKEPQWFSNDEADVPWVSIRDMGKAGMYIVETSERLTRDAIDKFNVRIIPRGTVIVSFKLTVGRVALAGFDLATNEAIAHLPLDEDSGLCVEYLYFALKRFPYNTLASTSSIATAVNSSTIRAIQISVPPVELVRQFQATVSPIFQMIDRTIEQSRTLEELRDSLLPRMISGELSIGRGA